MLHDTVVMKWQNGRYRDLTSDRKAKVEYGGREIDGWYEVCVCVYV